MLMLKFVLFIFYIFFISKCKCKDYCSVEYCNNGKQHTLCKYQSQTPASHCIDYEKTISSDDEKRAILDKINNRRNKVAAGEIRSLPSAENMMKLEWSDELETAAQRWADQCVKHSVPDTRDDCRDLGEIFVGQNIATILGDAPGLTPWALVDVWYMELLNMNASIMSRYEPSSESGRPHYEYFTQLFWGETKQVGCGGVKFKELLDDGTEMKYRTIYRLVCNFAPGGNLRNKTVYRSGTPCSGCPSDSVCDELYNGLCTQKHEATVKEVDNAAMNKLANEPDTRQKFAHMFDAVTENSAQDITTNNMSIEPESNDDKYSTFDYFSHLYEFTNQMITLHTIKTNSCKDVMAVDDFVEILKKKLSEDPMIRDLLTSTKLSGNNTDTEGPFHDNDGVAAFVDHVYNKKEASTTSKLIVTDYLNSTLLVDLIEAVIFRNPDKISVTEEYQFNTHPMAPIKPVMIQAELAEIKQNQDFTGHYFFPEEDEEEVKSEATESYYDNSNIPISDVALEIEELKLSTTTKDFLEDILESDTVTESTTTFDTVSPDNLNLYKSGHSMMRKFLENIAEKSQKSKNHEK